MPYFKFGPNDIFHNTIETHPKSSFLIHAGKTYYNEEIPDKSSTSPANPKGAYVNHAKSGDVSLYEINVNRQESFNRGESTKFVLPFELTKLFEGAADYVGYSRKAPDRQLSEVKDIEKALGKSEDVLGTIPTADEMQAELDAIKEEADEALQQVVDEGIKDQMTATEPPKELKEPEA